MPTTVYILTCTLISYGVCYEKGNCKLLALFNFCSYLYCYRVILQQTGRSEKSRWAAGVLVDSSPTTSEEELISTLEKHGYNQFTLTAVDSAIVAQFPFKSSISYYFAKARVFPLVQSFIQVSILRSYIISFHRIYFSFR